VSPPGEAGVSDDGPGAVDDVELPASVSFAAAGFDTEDDAIEMTLGPSLEPLAIELYDMTMVYVELIKLGGSEILNP
jgi:hypothetical protein